MKYIKWNSITKYEIKEIPINKKDILIWTLMILSLIAYEICDSKK